MTSKKVTVYALASSKDNVIRYIGQTVQNVKKRYYSHLSDKKYTHTHRGRWIESVKKSGYEILLIILNDDAVWNETEIQLISQFRSNGFDLVNTTDGGDGITGLKVSIETRAKISAGNKGKPKSKAHCQALSLSHMGHKPKPESIEKQRAKIKGIRPKNLNALHAAKIGVPRSIETKIKLSAAVKKYHSNKRAS